MESVYNQIMEKLTKGEEKIMHVLWDMEKGFVKDVIEQMGEPKPAYNTVSTIIRILVKKGFVSYKAYGKTHEYYPVVSKKEYCKYTFTGFFRNYFDGSLEKMVSFIAKEEKLSEKDINDLLEGVRKSKEE